MINSNNQLNIVSIKEKVIPQIEADVLSREGKKEGNEMRFLCPAHTDTHPSARWNPQKQVWCCDSCKANGGWKDLAGKLGIETRPERKDAPKLPKCYDYTDEKGTVLYQVLRYEMPDGTKRFSQRQPDGKGGWKNTVYGVRPVSYRLPELINATLETLVFIVEGEKDADRLASLGMVATTNSGGAGKWKPEHNQFLSGRRVVILPDNDEAGRKHAEQVRQSLQGIAASVKIVALPDLPEKGDVSDWLNAGHQPEELIALIRSMPIAEPELAENSKNQNFSKLPIMPLSSVKPEAVDFLWWPYLPKGKISMLVGDPAAGKTFLALTLASAVTRGFPLPCQEDGMPRGKGVEQGTVLYLSGEDAPGDTLRPRVDRLGGDPSKIYFWDATQANFPTLADPRLLEEALSSIKPALVVIDPLQAFLGAKVDMHRANEVRPVLAALAALAVKFNCAVLCLTHLRKGEAVQAIYRSLGSIDFAATARSMLMIGRDPQDGERRIMSQMKNSVARHGVSLGFALDRGSLEWTGKVECSPEELLAPVQPKRVTRIEPASALLQELLADGPKPRTDVMNEAGKRSISESAVTRAAGKLGVQSQATGFPARAVWSLPADSGEPDNTDTTDKTEKTERVEKEESLLSSSYASYASYASCVPTTDADPRLALVGSPLADRLPEQFSDLDDDGKAAA